MIGRLGKQAAEVALQFLADGMPLDDAVRAGAKLMDEELSPAAKMMLKQNKKSTDKNFQFWDNDYSFLGDEKPKQDMYDIQNVISGMLDYPSVPGQRSSILSSFVGDNIFDDRSPRNSRKIAADRYAVEQLLLDAAEGDMDVASALAQRLGFEWLL